MFRLIRREWREASPSDRFAWLWMLFVAVVLTAIAVHVWA